MRLPQPGRGALTPGPFFDLLRGSPSGDLRTAARAAPLLVERCRGTIPASPLEAMLHPRGGRMKKAVKRLVIVALECAVKILPVLTGWIILRLLG